MGPSSQMEFNLRTYAMDSTFIHHSRQLYGKSDTKQCYCFYQKAVLIDRTEQFSYIIMTRETQENALLLYYSSKLRTTTLFTLSQNSTFI